MSRANSAFIIIIVLVVLGAGIWWGVSGSGGGSNATSTGTTTGTTGSTTPTGGMAAMHSAAIGKTTTVSGVTLMPTSVVEDSRCPSNAQCVQAGTVRVSTQVGGVVAATTTTFALGAPQTIGGWNIDLVNVTPQPVTGQTIKSSSYTFYFTVTSATGVPSGQF